GRLSDAELGVAEKAPCPKSATAAEARVHLGNLNQSLTGQQAQLAQARNDMEREFVTKHLKLREAEIAQQELKIENLERRALAFLRTHGPKAAQAKVRYEDLLDGPAELAPI